MSHALTEKQAGSEYSTIFHGNRRGTGIDDQKVKPSTTAHELLQEIHISLVLSRL